MFETDVTLTVYADVTYFYEVKLGEFLQVMYKEHDSFEKTPRYINFGSLDEMEAVANAMLKAVEVKRQLKD